MQYALLIYSDPESFAALSENERQAISAEYWGLRDEPSVVLGMGLHPPNVATTVRVRDGATLVSDGPFADTREVFGGCYVIEADDLDTAIAMAARFPTHRIGGSVEVRPVLERPT